MCPSKLFDERAGRQVEDFDELVGRRRGESLAVGREGDAEDGVRVRLFQVERHAARGDFDEFHFAVFRRGTAGRGERHAVRREGEGDDGMGEAADAPFRRGRGDVPNRDFAEAARGERFAVRAQRHRFDERDVGGRHRLAVGRFQRGIDERFLECSRLRIEAEHAIAATGRRERLIRRHDDRPHGHDRRGGNRQGHGRPRFDFRLGRAFRPFADPAFDEGDFARRERVVFRLRRHDRLLAVRRHEKEQALRRLAGHDRRAFLAALHGRRQRAEVEVAFGDFPGMADGAFRREDRRISFS